MSLVIMDPALHVSCISADMLVGIGDLGNITAIKRQSDNARIISTRANMSTQNTENKLLQLVSAAATDFSPENFPDAKLSELKALLRASGLLMGG